MHRSVRRGSGSRRVSGRVPAVRTSLRTGERPRLGACVARSFERTQASSESLVRDGVMPQAARNDVEEVSERIGWVDRGPVIGAGFCGLAVAAGILMLFGEV